MDLECTSGEIRAAHEGAPRARPPASWGPLAPPTYPLHPYILLYPKTSRTVDRSGVPPPQASVATKNLSGTRCGTLPEGGTLNGGHLHHPDALHDEEGVVHPRGYVFDLSLSLVFLIWHDLDVPRALLL